MAAPQSTTGGMEATSLSPSRFTQATNIGNLHDKIALVTGASSGLGRSIAQAYAAAGAHVVNADLRPDPPLAPQMAAQDNFKHVDLTTPTVDLINAQFPDHVNGIPRAAFAECNVTDPASVEAAVALAVRIFGRLDIIVNNAGINAEGEGKGRFHERDVSVLDKNMAVNVKGVWLGCKYAIIQMLSQPPHPSGERGWIINMCSVMGLVGGRGSAAYCATKGAVLQMTKAIALDYAKDQIHVNCINPGFVETSLLEPLRDEEGKAMSGLARKHPWGRLALTEDIAKMAVFLAGDGASFVTGAAFVVDGGYTAQ